MAYQDAYLTNHQRLIFDTGSERIDLTPRVKGSGWGMDIGTEALTFEPLTREAVCRIAGPADVGMSITGMYYAEELFKVRQVRTANTSFALGLQYKGNPRVSASAPVKYFLGGFVKTDRIPVEGGSPILSVGSVTLNQQEPMFYGENWVQKATHTGSYSTSTYLELGQTFDLDFGSAANEELVFVYDLRGFEQVSGQDIGMRVRVDNERAGADRVFLYKQLLDPDSAERTKAGFVYFGEGEAEGKGGNGSHNGLAWPTSGTWRIGIEVNWAVANSIDIGFGYGHRIVTE